MEKNEEKELVIPPAMAEAVRLGTKTSVPLLGQADVGRADSIEWRIKIDGPLFLFSRFVNGQIDEAYRPVKRPEAAVWASAIIQNFEPPRSLLDSDRPAG